MADYIDAFKQGLAAAEAAERAKQEINEIFRELDIQMRAGSEGKISIDRKEYYVRDQGMAPAFAALATLPYVLGGRKRETYWAVVAENPLIPDSPTKELATWTQGRSGYPCKIAFANVDRSCADRESLEIALDVLLRDPTVGEKLSSLMRLEPPDSKKEEQSQQSDSAGSE
ncbi:hypothetical protein [Geobacter pickeringii]|uniref:Uncharacterized protein n=1 Tax=Geobacter pickeringii TaxID=345632 RepID=A0A0B5B6B1_9BACT|nr:hypothetical protein [Geobacter pickeringii]AJE02068.1 hypothetical protein GPICK_00565 [Geobacter pickeringii]